MTEEYNLRNVTILITLNFTLITITTLLITVLTGLTTVQNQDTWFNDTFMLIYWVIFFIYWSYYGKNIYF